jgi:hypothetical protein
LTTATSSAAHRTALTTNAPGADQPGAPPPARLRDLADQGQSMLLIEHDMGLVLGICDRVVVLEFGQVIAEGPPESVRQDSRVIAAYLGDGAAGDPGPADGGMVATALADDQTE